MNGKLARRLRREVAAKLYIEREEQIPALKKNWKNILAQKQFKRIYRARKRNELKRRQPWSSK